MNANLSPHSAPDAIEPVVGWRTWRVARTDEGLRLLPIAYRFDDTHWPARARFESACWRHRRHVAPDGDCTCGIHAAKGVKKALEYVNPYRLSRPKIVWFAIGCVYLWGKIIEHEHGYRAQYAYPKQILLPGEIFSRHLAVAVPDLATISAGLREAYGVPVLIVHTKPSLLDQLKGVR